MRFETLPLFDKQFKKLAKKYNHIKSDLQILVDDFDELHRQATPIKNNIYKIRLSNSNKNRGKSSGYRVYYYVKVNDIVYLSTIYDKSEIQMIDENIVFNAIKNIEI
jgi:mRNA-degrading endonuclease RelE of RelBE toxin-antitoxin system